MLKLKLMDNLLLDAALRHTKNKICNAVNLVTVFLSAIPP